MTLYQLEEKQLQALFSEESMASASDDVIKFYTALPNFKVLKTIFDHVHKTLPSHGITKLSPFQEFMCALLKLRMNTPLENLAYRFEISQATVSRIFLSG